MMKKKLVATLISISALSLVGCASSGNLASNDAKAEKKVVVAKSNGKGCIKTTGSRLGRRGCH